MQCVFLTARADVEILGKLITKDDVSEIDSRMELGKTNYAAAIENNSFILGLIKKSGVFAVNFSRIKNPGQTRIDGKYFDKFGKLGIPKKEAEKINCPLIGGADVLECEVNRIIEMGEKVLLIGNVLKKHKV